MIKVHSKNKLTAYDERNSDKVYQNITPKYFFFKFGTTWYTFHLLINNDAFGKNR